MSKKFDWSKTADNWTASTSIAQAKAAAAPKLGAMLLGKKVRPGWGLPMSLSDISRATAASRARMRGKGGSRSDAVKKAWITRRRGTSGKNK
jgi:hypothetical protein